MGVIIYVGPCERAQNRENIYQFLKLRKRIFCDHYGWVPANPDDTETDYLDDGYNVIILYLDTEINKVVGGVRLVPTTGQTLVHNVWSNMLPKPEEFKSPSIWEATRYCVDDSSSASRNTSFVNHATLALSVAIFDFSHANGISHIIGVCEKKFFNMSCAYGVDPRVISTRIDQNGTHIYCGLWPTGDAKRNTLAWARDFAGNAEPIRINVA